MSAQNPERVAAAISELANAIQIALPMSARIRERSEALATDAERLEAALSRAISGVRQLQPVQSTAER